MKFGDRECFHLEFADDSQKMIQHVAGASEMTAAAARVQVR
jgi:hypothetical protein